MPHVREQIRDQVYTYLVTNMTSVPTTQIYKSRVYPLDKVPAVVIVTENDRVDPERFRLGKRSERMLELLIEVRAKNTTEWDTQIDDATAEIENLLYTPFFATRWNGLITMLLLTDTELEYAGESEKPVGAATMHWQVGYAILADTPTQALGALS